MIIRISSLALGLFLFLAPLLTNAQGYGVVVDSADALPNQVVCLPVYAQGFTNIVGFQYSLTWDADVLNFDHIQHFNLPGSLQDFYSVPTPNRLLVAWSDPSVVGINMADGAMVYEVCFKAVSIVGSSTDITPGGEGFGPANGSAEAYNYSNENVWTPALNVPGYVAIVVQSGTTSTDEALLNGTDDFLLSPNPTYSNSLVTFNSKTAGVATLSVTDMQGRVVFDEKIAVQGGENSFEIPAKVLNTKGMYQVSLQTEERVSSRMLSVQ